MAGINDFSGLNVKVAALDGEVRELKAGFNSLALEMRQGFQALSDALAERGRTPWVAILSGAGVLVAVLGMVGSLALSPLQADMVLLKKEVVPRVEIDYRQVALNAVLAAMQKEIDDRNQATTIAVEKQFSGIVKLMDVEREAVHTSLERLYTHVQALDLRTTTPDKK